MTTGKTALCGSLWMTLALGCPLGDRNIGAIAVEGGGGGTTGISSGSASGSQSGTGPAAPTQCVEDFEVRADVAFLISPGPDGVGTLHVRITEAECMVGPAVGLWSSPEILHVSDLQADSDGIASSGLIRIPCTEGLPDTLLLAAFLDEGAHADPTDPLPKLGDMVNTITGFDGVAAPEDIAGGYTCVEIGDGPATVTYEIDEAWYTQRPTDPGSTGAPDLPTGP